MMRRKLSLLTAIFLAMAIVPLLGACSGNHRLVGDGPLRSSVDGHPVGGSNCVPGGKRQTFGDQTFINHGKFPLYWTGLSCFKRAMSESLAPTRFLVYT